MLWGASALFSFAQWMERIAVGWLVLDETGSVFLTALSWAVRSAPGVVAGPLAGVVADRYPRPAVLAIGSFAKAAAIVITGLIVLPGEPSVALVLILIAVSGAAAVFNVSALQPLLRDIAGESGTMNAVSLNSFGQRIGGAVGSLAAGVLIGVVGPGTTFLVAGALVVVSGLAFARVRTVGSRDGSDRPAFVRDLADGLRLLLDIRMVALLIGLMILIENFGFSVNALLPVVADEALNVGSTGLGALGTSFGVGSIVGTAALAALGDYRHKGYLLAGVVVSFGLLLVALGTADALVVALVVGAGLGGTMAMVDALEWILLQASVPDAYRGRAIGAWNLAIGLGLVGPVILGAIADRYGVEDALFASGALLTATGVLSLGSRALRQM